MTLTLSAAEIVRAEMKRQRLRQIDVALALGVSQAAVCKRLAGRSPFTLADLERLADLLGLDVRQLVQPRSDQKSEATA